MKYYDLDISITTEMGDHYVTRAQSQTMGESQGRLLFADLDQIRAAFQNLPLEDVEESALKDLGTSLFNALFSGQIGALYLKALGQVEADANTGIRIRLKIDPPVVAALPWEHLYDYGRDCFLATSSETLLTRYIETFRPIRDLQTVLPIQILVVIPGASGLDVELEKRTILAALAGLEGAVEITMHEGRVTSGSVSRELVLKQFHILHFIGHGAFEDEKGCLVLNCEEGDEEDLVSAKEFSFNFQDYPSMKLVVLNSCSGAASSSQSLTGVAHELVQKGVPAVIAMREEITDDAAKIFAKDFYFKLCVGYERGRVDIAISYARKQLIAGMSDTREFANPILFMRSPTGVIFDLGAPITSVGELDTNHAVKHTHNYNIAQITKEGGEGAAAEVAKENQAKSDVSARVNAFYKRIAIAAAPRVVAMALLLVLIVVLASQIRFLNIFGVDDYLTAGLHWWYGASNKPLDPKVSIILAGKNDQQALSQFGTKWREYHTALIDGLSRGQEKPSVIAMDLLFNDPAPHDKDLAFAIGKARSGGIQIVGSQNIDDNGNTDLKSELNPTLKPAFGDSWGDVLVGAEITLPWLWGAPIILHEYEIASLPKDANLAEDVVVVPSLALKAVMQHYNDAASPPQAYYSEGAGEVIIRAVDSGQPITRIPVTRIDRSLSIILEYASEAALSDRTTPYGDVYKWATSNQPEYQNYLGRLFKDQIVLIGFDTDVDTHDTIVGQRTGLAFHANAVSNILKSEYIPEISRVTDVIVIIVMVVVGVLLQTKLKPRLPGNLQLEFPYIGKIPIVLFSALILYLVVAYFVYSRARVRFDMSYHIAALLFGYWSISIFRKRLRLAGAAGGN